MSRATRMDRLEQAIAPRRRKLVILSRKGPEDDPRLEKEVADARARGDVPIVVESGFARFNSSTPPGATKADQFPELSIDELLRQVLHRDDEARRP